MGGKRLVISKQSRLGFLRSDVDPEDRMKLDAVPGGACRVVSLVEEPHSLDCNWDSATIPAARRWMEPRLKDSPSLLDLSLPRGIVCDLRWVGDFGDEGGVGH